MPPIPEPGFYYHYKHDPAKDAYTYMYEVTGLARDTEDEGYRVMYRPLYDSTFMPPAGHMVRPVAMFLETVVKDGIAMSRFTRVTDAALIAQLQKIKEERYPA